MVQIPDIRERWMAKKRNAGKQSRKRVAKHRDRVVVLTADLRRFASEREWEQFHSPKNLAMALAAEAGELLEIFQWLTEPQSRSLSTKQMAQAQEEVGDIQIYLLRLADRLGIDALAAAREKLGRNAAKYPVHKSRGNARKYTEFGA